MVGPSLIRDRQQRNKRENFHMANETTTSKSDKFNKAVDRATGKETAGSPATSVVIGDVGAMVSSFDASELNDLASSGKVEFAPQLMSLEEGQKIVGILEGMGPGNDFEDPVTHDIRHVDSWIIASPEGTLRVSILSSAQLDRKLPPFIGGMVGIARNKDLKIANGHRCADYQVWGPRMPEGKRRQWAALPSSTGQPALPAGGDVIATPATAPANHAS